MSMRRIDCPFCVGRLGYVSSTCEDCCGSGEIDESYEPALKRNGTMEAYGKTWPLYEYPSYSVEVVGYIPAESADSMEALRDELDEVFNKYGVKAQIRLVQKLRLSPRDQAEHDTLERAQAVMGP